MNRIWRLAVLLAALAGTAAAQAHYRMDGKAPLNDLKVSPGKADPALTKAKLCDPSFHTATARNVTEGTKRKVCAEYDRSGYAAKCPGPGYEIDHIISIELGGSNDIENLQPQPVDAAGVVGYHTKDKVENALHRKVCAGEISLGDAQKCIARDWYACAVKERILPQ